tara:strand:- start:55 stop:252 length:198 start_codon:yes stop_codon:yes gene_type:complete
MDKRDGIKKRLDNIVNDLLLSGEKDLILLGELLRLILKTMKRPKDFVGIVVTVMDYVRSLIGKSN